MPNPQDNPLLYQRFKLAGVFSPGLCAFNLPARDEGWTKQQGQGSAGTRLVHTTRPAIEFDVDLTLWKDDDRDCFAEWELFKAVLAKARVSQTVTPKLGSDPAVAAAHKKLQATEAKYQNFKPTNPPDTPAGKKEILFAQQQLQQARDGLDAAVAKASATAITERNTIKGLDIYHPQLAEIGVTSVVVKSWTGVQPIIGGQPRGGGKVRITFIENAPPTSTGVGAANGSAAGGISKKTGSQNDPNADLKAKVKQLTEEFKSP